MGRVQVPGRCHALSRHLREQQEQEQQRGSCSTLMRTQDALLEVDEDDAQQGRSHDRLSATEEEAPLMEVTGAAAAGSGQQRGDAPEGVFGWSTVPSELQDPEQAFDVATPPSPRHFGGGRPPAGWPGPLSPAPFGSRDWHDWPHKLA